MVRLKRYFGISKKTFGDLSQFHYGSIKTKYDKATIYSKEESQFHYGSIKTNHRRWIMRYSWLSQFHYGSIKTMMPV